MSVALNDDVQNADFVTEAGQIEREPRGRNSLKWDLKQSGVIERESEIRGNCQFVHWEKAFLFTIPFHSFF